MPDGAPFRFSSKQGTDAQPKRVYSGPTVSELLQCGLEKLIAVVLDRRKSTLHTL
jgi:hypothetical protein